MVQAKKQQQQQQPQQQLTNMHGTRRTRIVLLPAQVPLLPLLSAAFLVLHLWSPGAPGGGGGGGGSGPLQGVLADTAYVSNNGQACPQAPCFQGPTALSQVLAQNYSEVRVLDGYSMSAASSISVGPYATLIRGHPDLSRIFIDQACPASVPQDFAFFVVTSAVEFSLLTFTDLCTGIGPHSIIHGGANHDLRVSTSSFPGGGNTDLTFVSAGPEAGKLRVWRTTMSGGGTAIYHSTSAAAQSLIISQNDFSANERDIVVVPPAASSGTSGPASFDISENLFEGTKVAPVDFALRDQLSGRTTVYDNIFRNCKGVAITMSNQNSVVSSADRIAFKRNHIVGTGSYAFQLKSPFVGTLIVNNNNLYGNNGAPTKGTTSGATAQFLIASGLEGQVSFGGNYWGEGTSRALLFEDEAYDSRVGFPLSVTETPVTLRGAASVEGTINAYGLDITPTNVSFNVAVNFDNPTTAPYGVPVYPLRCSSYFHVRATQSITSSLSMAFSYNQTTHAQSCVEWIETLPESDLLLFYLPMDSATSSPATGENWTPVAGSTLQRDSSTKTLTLSVDSASSLIPLLETVGVPFTIFFVVSAQFERESQIVPQSAGSLLVPLSLSYLYPQNLSIPVSLSPDSALSVVPLVSPIVIPAGVSNYSLPLTISAKEPLSNPLKVNITLLIGDGASLSVFLGATFRLSVTINPPGVSLTPDDPGKNSIQVDFQGETPNHQIIPLHPCTGKPLYDLALLAEFASVEEIGKDGETVAEVIFPSQGYKFNSTGQTALIELSDTAVYTWNFQLLEEGAVVAPLPSSSFAVDRATNKWSIDITGWKFSSSDSTLKLHIKLFSNDGPFTAREKDSTQADIGLTSYTLLTANTEVKVGLLNWALTDGTQDKKPVMAQFASDQSEITFQFPYFKTALSFDPDFSVLVDPESPRGAELSGDECASSSDGSDDSSNRILVIVIPVVVGSVILAGLIAGVIYVVVRKKRHMTATRRVNRLSMRDTNTSVSG